MSRQSPYTITYKDLIAYMTKQVGYARQRTSAARSRGVTYMDPMIHEEECAKKLKQMLDRCQPGKQADLFELFEQVKK